MYFKKLYACINVNSIFYHPFLSVLVVYLLSSAAYASTTPVKPSESQWHYAEQGIMGTVITLKLQHHDKAIAQEATEEVFRLMWDINNEMSNYKPDSLLSKINKKAHISPVKLSGRLFGLIAKS